MPRPLRNEKRNKFIARAVKYMISKEGLTKKHAIGKAYGLWQFYKKKKRK